MDMLVDKRYFIGEINVPNVNTLSAGVIAAVCNANEVVLNRFIRKYEKSFRIKVLGVSLDADFENGISQQDIPEKWSILKRLLADEDNLTSPISNYTYYWYMRDKITSTTGIGEVTGRADNASVTSPSEKMIRAWNEMVDEVGSIVAYVGGNSNDYKNFCPDLKSDIFFKINSMNL